MRSLIWAGLALSPSLVACDDSAGTDANDARVSPGGDGGVPGHDMAVVSPDEISVAITTADGAVTGETSITIEGTVAHADAVDVNGTAATVSGGTWSVELTGLAEGPHTITATAGPQTASIGIVVDLTPPRIDITGPARGTHTEADRFDLAFTVTEGISHLVDVTRDGLPLDVEDGPDFTLSGMVLDPGLNLFGLQAIDAAGHETNEHIAVLQGPLRDPDEVVDGAIRMQLGTAAIDALEQLAVSMLAAQDLAALLPNPLLENPATITVEQVTYTGLTVELTPGDGELALRAELSGVTVGVGIAVRDNDPITQVNVGVQRVQVDGVLIPRIEGGALVAEVPDERVEVSFVGLEVSLDDVPDFGDDPDAEASLLEQVIGEGLAIAIGRMVPTALQDLLAQLDEPIDFEVLGATLNLELVPEVVLVNNLGISLVIGVDVGLLGEANPPSPIAGYLTTPATWNGVPDTDQLGLAIDDDLINAVLFALWRSGALLPVIDDAFIAEGGAPFALVRNLLRGVARDADPELPNNTPLKAVTHLPLPITTRLRKGDDNQVGLQFGLGEMSLDVATDDENDRMLVDGVASLLLDGRVGVELGDAGALNLLVDIERFTTAFDVLDDHLRGLPEASIEARVGDLLGAIGQLLPGLVSGIDLPTIDQVPLGAVSIDVAPQDPNFLLLTVELAN